MFAQALDRSAKTTTDPQGPWPTAVPDRRDRTRQIGSRRIVAESAATRHVLEQIEQVAPTTATVLLLGETGVGKEVFAQIAHDLSPRHLREMVHVNCGAIPTTLMESELFGHERGAYTGAVARQIGRIEAADRSTLFLDEIGDLSLDDQVKLLRVLQDRVIERLGNPRPIGVDIRVIAATNRDLGEAIQQRAFREDLYYRLSVFPVVVPPLRERREDIAPLAWEFAKECARTFGRTVESIAPESLRRLEDYAWPGNIRELRNLIERAVIVSRSPHLSVGVPDAPGPAVPDRRTLTSVESGHIRAMLERSRWRVRGPGGAAELLGMKPTTLETRMAKLGILRPKPDQSGFGR